MVEFDDENTGGDEKSEENERWLNIQRRVRRLRDKIFDGEAKLPEHEDE